MNRIAPIVVGILSVVIAGSVLAQGSRSESSRMVAPEKKSAAIPLAASAAENFSKAAEPAAVAIRQQAFHADTPVITVEAVEAGGTWNVQVQCTESSLCKGPVRTRFVEGQAAISVSELLQAICRRGSYVHRAEIIDTYAAYSLNAKCGEEIVQVYEMTSKNDSVRLFNLLVPG